MRHHRDQGAATLYSLVAVMLFMMMAATMVQFTAVTIRDGNRTNARIDARTQARSALDIVGADLAAADTTTALTPWESGQWEVNAATGTLEACSDPNGEGCVTIAVDVTDNGDNDLVAVTAVAGQRCDASGCAINAAIRDTYRERSLLDYVMHSDSEALEDATEPDCALPASARPASCVQAAWNSILPAATPTAEIAPGMIVAYAGTDTPAGWVEADGSSHSNGDLPELAATLGTLYGGSGGSFNVPDLRGRTIQGIGADTRFDTIGEAGGAASLALTAPQLPSHTHSGVSHSHTVGSHNHSTGSHNHSASTSAAGGHAHRVGWQGQSGSQNGFNISGWGTAAFDGGGFVEAAGNHSHTFTLGSVGVSVGSAASSISTAAGQTTSSTGSGAAHDNLQPYLVLRWLISATPDAVIAPGMMAPTIIEGDTPLGWADADGTLYGALDQPDLYNAIGTTYGGGSGAFGTPNPAGYTIVGQHTGDTAFDQLGETGGSLTATLTEAQLAAHNHTTASHGHTGDTHNHSAGGHSHSGSTNTTGNHTHAVGWSGGGSGSGNRAPLFAHNRVPNGSNLMEAAGNHRHTIYPSARSVTTSSSTPTIGSSGAGTTSSTGSGAAHDNLGPVAALRWLIALDPDATFAPGMVTARADSSLYNPSNWLDLDGTPASRVDDSLLWLALGDQYGPGDGSTTFDLPSLAGVAVIGVDASNGDIDALGETAGAADVALTEAELPGHTHTTPNHSHSAGSHNHSTSHDHANVHTNYSGNHSHRMGWDGSPSGTGNALDVLSYGNLATTAYNVVGAVGNHAHTTSIGSSSFSISTDPGGSTGAAVPSVSAAGSNQAHPNLSPFLTMRWVVSAAPSDAGDPPDQIDVVTGPIHTNDDYLLICGSPTFTDVHVAGPAATAPFWAYSTGSNCNLGAPVITAGGGFSLADPLILPETEEWLDAAKTLPGTTTYTGAATIVFNGTTYDVTGGGVGAATGVAYPASGVIYVAGDVAVSGVIDGQVSVVTEGLLEIPDHLRYACVPIGAADPSDIPADCDDVIGLNAQTGVRIEYGNTIPGDDRVINAAIAAVDGSVRVDKWATSELPPGLSTPTLYLGGAIVANYRGVYGAYDGDTGELRSGFRKYFTYDERFRSVQPPFFVSPAGTRWARIDSTDIAAGTT